MAADVLSFLPPDNRAEVMQSREVRDGTAVSDGRARADHGRAVLEQFFCPVIEFWRREDRGQNHELCEGRSRNLRDAVTTALDEELTLQIQDNMFTFENLSMVDNRAIQVMMRNIEFDLLMVALKGASEETRDKFFDNMSQREAMSIDDMESKGPMRISDVEDAQKNIMRIARKPSDSGEPVLAGRGDDLLTPMKKSCGS